MQAIKVKRNLNYEREAINALDENNLFNQTDNIVFQNTMLSNTLN
jgi:hypothetical protein